MSNIWPKITNIYTYLPRKIVPTRWQGKNSSDMVAQKIVPTRWQLVWAFILTNYFGGRWLVVECYFTWPSR